MPVKLATVKETIRTGLHDGTSQRAQNLFVAVSCMGMFSNLLACMPTYLLKFSCCDCLFSGGPLRPHPASLQLALRPDLRGVAQVHPGRAQSLRHHPRPQHLHDTQVFGRSGDVTARKRRRKIINVEARGDKS